MATGRVISVQWRINVANRFASNIGFKIRFNLKECDYVSVLEPVIRMN